MSLIESRGDTDRDLALLGLACAAGAVVVVAAMGVLMAATAAATGNGALRAVSVTYSVPTVSAGLGRGRSGRPCRC